MKKLILCAGFLLLLCAGLWGVDYTWTGAVDGAWTTAANWTADPVAAPVPPSNPFDAADTLIIDVAPGGTNLGPPPNYLENTASLAVRNGTLTLVNDLNSTGSIVIDGTGVLDIDNHNLIAAGITANGTLNLAGAGQTVTDGTSPIPINGTGTVNFNAPGTDLAGITSFPNLTISGGGARSISSGLIVNGSINVSAGTINFGGNNLTVTGTGTVSFPTPGTVSGISNLDMNGFGLQYINITDNPVDGLTISNTGGSVALGNALTVTGNVNLNGNFEGRDYALIVGGNWIRTGYGTFDSGTGSGSVTFNGTGDQYIQPAGSTFDIITVNATTANLDIQDSLTANGTITFSNNGDVSLQGTLKSTNDNILLLNTGKVSGSTVSLEAGGTVSGTSYIEADDLIVTADIIYLGSSVPPARRNVITNSVELNSTNTSGTNVHFYNAAPDGLLEVSGTTSNTSPLGSVFIYETGDVSIASGGLAMANNWITITSTSGKVAAAGAVTCGVLTVYACTGIELDSPVNNVADGAMLYNNQTDAPQTGDILFINNGGTDILLHGANSAANGSITVENRAAGINIQSPGIITAAGAIKVISGGDITLQNGANITTSHTGNTDAPPGPAVYFSADDIVYQGGGTTTGGSGTNKGIVDLWVSAYPTAYIAHLVSQSIPYHLHLPINTDLLYSDNDHRGVLSIPTALWVDSSVPLGSPSYFVGDNFDIYVGDVNGTNLNNPSFSAAGDGVIRFFGTYTSDGGLTLNPGTGGIQLDGAVIELTAAPFTVSDGDAVLLRGTTSSSIKATGITLGGTVNGTTDLVNDLTLESTRSGANGAITVKGTVGAANPRLGDLVVKHNTSAQDTTPADFNSPVNVESFDFDGAALKINGAMSVAGTTTVTNAGIFTITGTGSISSNGAFTQDGAGGTNISGNILTYQKLEFAATVTIGTSDQAVVFSTANNPINLKASLAVNEAAGITGSLTVESAGPGGTIVLGDPTNPTSVELSGTFEVYAAGTDGVLGLTGVTTASTGILTIGSLTKATDLFVRDGTLNPRNILLVSGNTQNDGTINASALTSSDVAIIFAGDYASSAALNAGTLVGSTTAGKHLDFRGDAAFNGVTHNGNIIRFTGPAATPTRHELRSVGNNTPRLLGDVIIDADNTVELMNNARIRQDDGSTLTLKAETSPGAKDGGKLIAENGIWYMGGAPFTLPPWFTTGGFAGNDGTLVMEAGTILQPRHFWNTEQPAHEVRIAGKDAAISALGNVEIRSEFVRETGFYLHDATLEMRGTAGGSLNVPSIPPVFLCNLLISGTNKYLDTHDIFLKGSVTIGSGGSLNSNGKNITLLPREDPSLSPANLWEQRGTGTFIYGNSTVEFGEAAQTSHTYDIIGDTTWGTLKCVENGATLRFSNYSLPGTAGHTVYHLLHIDSSGTDSITLTRQDDTIPPYPNPTFSYLPPRTVNNHFWFFTLDAAARMDLDYVDIRYSFSRNKIPVPREGIGTNIQALPYVLVLTPSEALPVPAPAGGYEITTTGNRAYVDDPYWNHWNVNWFELNNFMYGFTEDANHNGRIDRIRLQAGFGLNGNTSGLVIAVTNAVTGEPYTVTGSRRVQEDERDGTYDLDSIYVNLEEKPYSDTGAVLHWTIVRNATLRDLALNVTLIENPVYEPGRGWGQFTTDTAPPRINYALALPGNNEIFFRMSEPLSNPSALKVSASGTSLGALTTRGLAGGQEFISAADSGVLGLAELAAGTASFTFDFTDPGDVIRDRAVPAQNLNHASSGEKYYFMFPAPKYPQNYNYDDTTGGGIVAGTYAPYQPYVPVDGVGTSIDPFTISQPGYWTVSWPPDLIPLVDNTFNKNTSYDFATGSPAKHYYEAAATDHRITDLLISMPPSELKTGSPQHNWFFVWPLWAKYEDFAFESGNLGDVSLPGYGYMGQGGGDSLFNDASVIWDFTGKRFLERNSIIVQSRVSEKLAVTSTRLLPYFNAPDHIRSLEGVHGVQGLWLWNQNQQGTPTMNPLSINLVPWFVQNGSLPLAQLSDSAPPLFKHRLDKSRYTTNGTEEFFLWLDVSPPDLLAARLELPADIAAGTDPRSLSGKPWYRWVRPFTFGIHDITRQRGGVTILNNVIKAGNERVFIDYKPESSGRVTIQVFTLDGNLVKILKRAQYFKVDDKYQRVSWDGTNNGGRPVARGMYFVRVVAPGLDEIRKVMVVK